MSKPKFTLTVGLILGAALIGTTGCAEKSHSSPPPQQTVDTRAPEQKFLDAGLKDNSLKVGNIFVVPASGNDGPLYLQIQKLDSSLPGIIKAPGAADDPSSWDLGKVNCATATYMAADKYIGLDAQLLVPSSHTVTRCIPASQAKSPSVP